jgi:hypothetical protein
MKRAPAGPKDNIDLACKAEANGSMWLARFNELDEAGKGGTKKAEYCLDRSQYWLDRANELRGWN